MKKHQSPPFITFPDTLEERFPLQQTLEGYWELDISVIWRECLFSTPVCWQYDRERDASRELIIYSYSPIIVAGLPTGWSARLLVGEVSQSSENNIYNPFTFDLKPNLLLSCRRQLGSVIERSHLQLGSAWLQMQASLWSSAYPGKMQSVGSFAVCFFICVIVKSAVAVLYIYRNCCLLSVWAIL